MLSPAALVVFLSLLSVFVCLTLSPNPFLCSQWDIWRAPASAVLPQFWDADERVVHVSVWPRLLLENPLVRLLRRHPGKDTTSQSRVLSFVP